MFALIILAALGASCANPSILSAKVQSMNANGGLQHITIGITVENLGDLKQPSNLLQSLDVLQDGDKVGKIGLQPLAPKQSQNVSYAFDRSVDAGAGTTNLTFMLDFNGRSGSGVTCHAGRETLKFTV